MKNIIIFLSRPNRAFPEPVEGGPLNLSKGPLSLSKGQPNPKKLCILGDLGVFQNPPKAKFFSKISFTDILHIFDRGFIYYAYAFVYKFTRVSLIYGGIYD